MNFNKKHKLLTVFYDYDLEQTNKGASKDLSKSLCVDEIIYLNKWSNENFDELYLLIGQLSSLNFINVAEQNCECSKEYIKYFITTEGKLAYYNKYFLNQLWHRDIRYLIPVIIAALAFLTSLGNALYTISNNRKIEKLQEQVQELKTDKSQGVKKVE